MNAIIANTDNLKVFTIEVIRRYYATFTIAAHDDQEAIRLMRSEGSSYDIPDEFKPKYEDDNEYSIELKTVPVSPDIDLIEEYTLIVQNPNVARRLKELEDRDKAIDSIFNEEQLK